MTKISNIANIVKLANIDKIHKCLPNPTNVYQIPQKCTKIPLSLTSPPVWLTDIHQL